MTVISRFQYSLWLSHLSGPGHKRCTHVLSGFIFFKKTHQMQTLHSHLSEPEGHRAPLGKADAVSHSCAAQSADTHSQNKPRTQHVNYFLNFDLILCAPDSAIPVELWLCQHHKRRFDSQSILCTPSSHLLSLLLPSLPGRRPPFSWRQEPAPRRCIGSQLAPLISLLLQPSFH